MDKQTFLQKSRDLHGYKYQYINIPEKIKLNDYIELEYDGALYKQRVSKHLLGKCPEKNTPKKSKEQFIKESLEVWGDRFDYSECEYVNANSKIRFFDKVNNRHVEQVASLHIQGFEPKKMDEDSFIIESELVSDYKYGYANCVYKNKTQKISLNCPIHGEFEVRPFDHLNYGVECERCEDGIGKKYISRFLDRHKISHYKEYKFSDCRNNSPLPFDFYIPSMRTCIEFDGIQHFQPSEFFGGVETFEKLKRNDGIKSDYCEENYINLIRIRHDQLNKVEEILWRNLGERIKG